MRVRFYPVGNDSLLPSWVERHISTVPRVGETVRLYRWEVPDTGPSGVSPFLREVTKIIHDTDHDRVEVYVK